jgi:hypothetical protein
MTVPCHCRAFCLLHDEAAAQRLSVLFTVRACACGSRLATCLAVAAMLSGPRHSYSCCSTPHDTTRPQHTCVSHTYLIQMASPPPHHHHHTQLPLGQRHCEGGSGAQARGGPPAGQHSGREAAPATVAAGGEWGRGSCGSALEGQWFSGQLGIKAARQAGRSGLVCAHTAKRQLSNQTAASPLVGACCLRAARLRVTPAG